MSFKYATYRCFVLLLLTFLGLTVLSSCSDLEESPRTFLLFDEGWKFILGEKSGAEDPAFDDDSWRSVDLPHDWSIEDLPGTDSPLDPEAVGGISTGYFKGGTAWYRKVFPAPEEMADKRVTLYFEGVYMDADVWLNGKYLGKHPYGYTGFWFDISDHLLTHKENVVVVRVKNEGRNSRWYSGSGIYRHVWLQVTEAVHLDSWGTAITTPEIREDVATVVVSNDVLNETGQEINLEISTTILDEKGEQVAAIKQLVLAEAGKAFHMEQELLVESPRLWGPETPVLYTVLTELRNESSALLDRKKTPFGIRSIEFSTEGFFLNGKKTLLKGGCMHHGNGPLGAAAYDRAEERRVELMKANGFNSIRCAHNPPSSAFLDACDRLGILVIDEFSDMWREAKNPMDYHRFFDAWWKKDVESMLKRDRNHPSIIMWSTGNEIPERGDPQGVVTSEMLAKYVRQLDPSRPVTAAVNGLGPDKDPYFASLDIAGYNYSYGGDHQKENIFEMDHQRLPERIMYCAESYPLTAFGAWMDVLDHPYVLGDFVWTGFDYLGEASIGWLGYPHEGSFFPWNQAYCGDIDICGLKRPQSYYRNVLWNTGRRLSIFVKPPEPSFEENPDRRDWSKWHWQDVVDSWNWEGWENEALEVEVYCAHEEVELILNEKSLGKQKTNRENQWIGRWTVPYVPGELKATAYSQGEQVDSWKLVTASEPAQLMLLADRSSIKADGQDLSFIQVELRDGEGKRCATAENLIDFEISGPGILAAVGSSNPMSSESFQQPRRKTYQGRCLVIIRSTREEGDIRLEASAEGIAPVSIVIQSIKNI